MKRAIHSVLAKLGYRIVRIEQAPTKPSQELSLFLLLLKRFGFAPKHILDIGANRGAWTRGALKVFPDARYTLVEPQDRLKEYAQDLLQNGSKVKWINAGASDQSGVLPFTITGTDGSCTFALTGGRPKLRD